MAVLSPTYVGRSDGVGSIDDITISYPSGVEKDDLLIIPVEFATTGSLTIPSGWVNALAGEPILSQPNSANGQDAKFVLLYRWHSGSGEPSDVTIADTGDHTVGYMFAYRNVDQNNLLLSAALGDGVNTTTYIFPSVTTQRNGCRIVTVGWIGIDQNFTDTAPSYGGSANLTDFTGRYTYLNNAGNGGGSTFADGILTVAGETGTIAGVTNAGPILVRGITVALRPKRIKRSILIT